MFLFFFMIQKPYKKKLYSSHQFLRVINKNNIMKGIQTMPIKEMYKEVRNIKDNSIYGYHIEHKYEDPEKQLKSKMGSKSQSHRHLTKKGHYLQDEIKSKKHVPGPGKYKLKGDWPKKTNEKHFYSDKKTFIEELMHAKTRQKIPGPGKYPINRDLGSKRQGVQNPPYNERITYLDNAQYEGLITPGVGEYQVKMRSKTQHRYDDTSPQHWIKKHNEQKNKKKQPIFPDVGSYNPRTIEYKLFGNKEQHKSNKNLMGKIDRFKTEPKGSSLGPGQYNVLVEWPGKGKNKNQLLTSYKGLPQRVYN